MSSLKSSWVCDPNQDHSKPWGKETVWTGAFAGNVKVLTLKKGERTSFKINQTKDEMLICASGTVQAHFGDEDLVKLGEGELKQSIMGPGLALVVQSGCPYRIEAIETATLLEVSSSQGNDMIVRIHDDYGRETTYVNDHLDNIVKNLWERHG